MIAFYDLAELKIFLPVSDEEQIFFGIFLLYNILKFQNLRLVSVVFIHMMARCRDFL